MLTVYGVRFQAVQDNYHQDGDKRRFINELRYLALDIRRKESKDLQELLQVVERREEYLTRVLAMKVPSLV